MLLIAELCKILTDIDVDSGRLKTDLIQKSQAHNIAHTRVMRKVKKEGWYGKPKGVLQILRERGYIKPDLPKLDSYTMKGWFIC